jgi:hypothetical protein
LGRSSFRRAIPKLGSLIPKSGVDSSTVRSSRGSAGVAWPRSRRPTSGPTSPTGRKKGYANATIKRDLSALKRMFTLAIQAGKLLQRPHIPMLAEHNVRKSFFKRAQFEAVRNRLPPVYQAIARWPITAAGALTARS